MKLEARAAKLQEFDPEVSQLLVAEEKRQQHVFRLIPSENYLFEPARIALATCFTDKYSEGYPHKWQKGERVDGDGRYYQGQENTNRLERIARDRAISLFAPKGEESGYHANVQALSGANANLAVYNALMQPGDKLLGMSLDHGGHLTHGHKVSVSSIFFEAQQYTLGKDGRLDYDAIREQARSFRPKVIVCGASSYPRQIDFAAFGSIAKEVGALLVADVAHISGLCVTGNHPHPFPHADVVTTTTHKILRGPRGGLIICKKEHGAAIDRSVFPGLQGGPHMNKVAALAIVLKHALSEDYRRYATQVVTNAKALAAGLTSEGFELVTGGTDNHLLLIDLKRGLAEGKDIDGTLFAEKLEQAGIVLNKNAIPGDDKPWKPTGVRLGTPAITSLGMGTPEMEQLAGWFGKLLKSGCSDSAIEEIRTAVNQTMARFKLEPWLL